MTSLKLKNNLAAFSHALRNDKKLGVIYKYWGNPLARVNLIPTSDFSMIIKECSDGMISIIRVESDVTILVIHFSNWFQSSIYEKSSVNRPYGK